MNVVEEVFDKVSRIALEDWGLMLVEPLKFAPDLFEGEDDPVYIGSMTFRGVMDGTISLLCHESFMEAICANLIDIGPDEGLTLEERLDALKELTNVLSGNFLTEAYGDDTVFELVHPAARLAEPEDFERFFQNRVIYCFEADDEPVAIGLGTAIAEKSNGH